MPGSDGPKGRAEERTEGGRLERYLDRYPCGPGQHPFALLVARGMPGALLYCPRCGKREQRLTAPPCMVCDETEATLAAVVVDDGPARFIGGLCRRCLEEFEARGTVRRWRFDGTVTVEPGER